MRLRWRHTCVIVLLTILGSFAISAARAQTPVSYQVGADGDSSSAGNYGVRVSIRTQAYLISNVDGNDAFFVGSHLSGGAFIQFGYRIIVGYICLHGFYSSSQESQCSESEDVANGDVRWFWQYWPNEIGSKGFYYASGPSMSAGSNGTWHTYSIVDVSNESWSFVLDRVQVDSLKVKPASSSSPPYEAAEQVTAGSTGRLGPVEFRNLSYYSSGAWHLVAFLRLGKTCGITTNCNMPSYFDSRFLGDNWVLAGSLSPITTSTTTSTSNMNTNESSPPSRFDYTFAFGLIVSAILVFYFSMKMKSQKAR